MIGKSKSIAHGKVALNYAINKKDAKVILTNGLSSYNANQIYKEMIQYHKRSQNCKNRFIRTEISPHPKDGKAFSNRDFVNLAKRVSQKMNLEDHQWVAVIHNDTSKPHLHMIFNRMDYKYKAYEDSFISNRTSKVAEEIANEMSLTLANDIHKELRNTIKEISDKALSVCKTYKEYKDFLANDEIEVIPVKRKESSDVYGHKLKYKDRTYKASYIHRSMSFNKIINQLEENRIKNEQGKDRGFVRNR